MTVPGMAYDGGYAEYMIAPIEALAAIPDDLDAVAAAPLLCAGITTYQFAPQLRRAAGDLVAVLGIGGLGHLGVQFAAKMGFRTVAIARGKDKQAARARTRRPSLHRQQGRGRGQGADRDGRGESDPRHRGERQGDDAADRRARHRRQAARRRGFARADRGYARPADLRSTRGRGLAVGHGRSIRRTPCASACSPASKR